MVLESTTVGFVFNLLKNKKYLFQVMHNKSRVSNFVNEDLNPCLEETKSSLICLEENVYDYDKCATYFLNYKICKNFWINLSKKRQKAGIFPNLPDKSEREKILRLKDKGIKVISTD